MCLSCVCVCVCVCVFVCVYTCALGYLIMLLCLFVPHLDPLPPTARCWVCAGPELWEHETESCMNTHTHTASKVTSSLCQTEKMIMMMKACVTSGGAAVHRTGSPLGELPYCSLRTWPGLRRRPAGQPSRGGSRCRHLRFPLSPAGRTAAAWHPGLTPLKHPRGRIWHET